MKIFLDTANLDYIKKFGDMNIIDGVTTNPTHLSKEQQDPTQQVKSICALLPHGLISVEITKQEPQAVYQQAQAIAQLAPNILVKIPCHQDYYPVIARLTKEGIKLNITLVFTLVQSLMMAKLGATYISPFIGRLAELDAQNAYNLLPNIRTMIDSYEFNTKILAASLRTIEHLNYAIQAGADAATVPPELLKQSLAHTLTTQGMAKFDADWHRLGTKGFPD